MWQNQDSAPWCSNITTCDGDVTRQDDVTAGELDPGRVRHMAVKYEYSTRPARGATRQEDSVLLDRSNAGFKLEVDRIGVRPPPLNVRRRLGFQNLWPVI